MLVLSAAQIVNGFFGIVWPLLVMTGHEQAGFRGLLISTTANVALNALLIPIWGATGAAVASGTSIVTWNVLFWVSVRRHLRIDGSLTGLFHRPPAAGTNLS
jgi:O-antigen/teichoic acid export membrane protein